MNKYLRVFGILALLCFSFYYTEQIAHFMQSKDPIYEAILLSKEDYEVPFVNATVEDSYVIPGLVGKEVNVDKSFQNMKNLGYFRESFFVFDEVKPEISFEDHKDKIISRGNPQKQAISLVFEDESYIPYLEEMGMKYHFLTTKNTVLKQLKYGKKINYDFSSYDSVEKEMKLQKEESAYCFISSGHEDFCKKKKKILIQETISIEKNTFSLQYQNISSGSILYIHNNLGVTNLHLLLNQIYFKGYQVVFLDELLSESRN